MSAAERIIAELRSRGELWESTAGLCGLRGDVLELYRAMERALSTLASATDAEPCEEWATPAGIALQTLARASYFESFPQWLTLASHLREDAESLERVARSDHPADAARHACAPADAALPPAVCYHVYEAFAGRTLHHPAYVTAQGTCWRHEGDRLRPLARGWAFTMREGVCLGGEQDVVTFRARGIERALGFAEAIGLSARLELATDPFFAPTSRGRSLLQRVKGLKQELLLPVGDEAIAAGSFNHHESFFGDAFGIRLADGGSASSACIAFGIERWVLAYLAAHGTAARGWTSLQTLNIEEATA